MKLLVIDNYDSFTYNLVQYFQILGCDVAVRRNDEVSLEHVKKAKPEAIVISPGPCTPKEAGISVDVIKEFYRELPILGVCLGHQAIGYAFGGKIVRAKNLMHGKASLIYHMSDGIFKGIKNPFSAIRYHSLVVERESLPDVLKITAESDDGEIMGLEHRDYPVFGLQFHPESVLSECGTDLLKNFLEIAQGIHLSI
ncbi:MAG: anthranilate synthase component II [Aquificaceae bacterium]